MGRSLTVRNRRVAFLRRPRAARQPVRLDRLFVREPSCNVRIVPVGGWRGQCRGRGMTRSGSALVVAIALSGCGLRSPDRAPAGPADGRAARHRARRVRVVHRASEGPVRRRHGRGPSARSWTRATSSTSARARSTRARAIARAHTPDAQKTVVVWGAGNLRTMLGDGARFEAMELVLSFEDLRGHNIGVTTSAARGRGKEPRRRRARPPSAGAGTIGRAPRR